MKKLMVGCLCATVTALYAGAALAADDKKTEKKATHAMEHHHGGPHMIHAIYGNPGFHYGSHYSMYTMHVHHAEAQGEHGEQHGEHQGEHH